MVRKTILIVFVGALFIIALAWFNRTSIFLFIAYNTGKVDVAENQEINWESGPAPANLEPGATPPNIVFILADDLGINDISTFGGGVANGRVQTPHIDRLAADGAIFSTAYAGGATCAPSRAMLMTGRYPARTGYEFTPAPDSMGPLIARVTPNTQVEYGLPPLVHNPAHEEVGIEAGRGDAR